VSVAAPSPQIDSLTALRGFLAVWVVLYHFANDLIRLFPAFDTADPFLRNGHFAVPGFFVLSGFVLAHNYAARFQHLSVREVVRFWALRLARIYPVHLVTLLIVAAMVGVADLVGFSLTDAGYTARDFVLNLFLVHTWVPEFRLNWNYPSWSISSEWFAYLAFPLAASWLLPRVGTPLRAWGLGVVCVVGTFAVYLRGPFPFRELVCVIPTFFAGAAIHATTWNRFTATSVAARILPNILTVVCIVACFVPGEMSVVLLLLGLFGLVWSLVRVADRPTRIWVVPGFVFLGEVSYSLYMTHTLAQKVLYKLLPTRRFEDDSVVLKLGVASIYLLLIVMCCLAMYYFVEQPSRRWFRKKFDPSQKARGLGPKA
jgi:peptidoglycan/LPS O-acetylase OafA/YrhL